MDHFTYKDGVLTAEDVPIPQIAEAIGTPFYCYSSATLARHYQVFSESFADVNALICFAVKANSNLAVLRTLADLGSGADAVSEGEIRRALAAGIPAEKIVFSGVGKTRGEMRYALEQGIHQFNVESVEELAVLNEVAGEIGVSAPVAIRVNPDVDAATHDKISTGRKEDKFGVAWSQVPALYEQARDAEHIEVVGISTHIGSQLTSLAPFEEAFAKVVGLVQELRNAGHPIARVDLGGGLGIPYAEGDNVPHPEAYAEVVVNSIKELDCELILEPGRLIAGNAGILVSEVIFVKETEQRNFVIVDAAMNDLLRPSLYGAHHEIVSVNETADTMQADVVGPVCETGDILAQDRTIPTVTAGDLIALRSAGAYGAVMAHSYNSRLLVPEVLVKGDQFAAVRARPSYADLLAQDTIPEWV